MPRSLYFQNMFYNMAAAVLAATRYGGQRRLRLREYALAGDRLRSARSSRSNDWEASVGNRPTPGAGCAEILSAKRPFPGCGKLIPVLKISEGKCLGDQSGLEPDLEQDPRVKAMLRLASFTFPSIVTILALLLCWRAHFSKNSLLASAFILALGIYFAIYYHRRSRGQSANLGYNNPGPDRDWSYNDQSDIGSLWGAAIVIGGTVYMVIKYW